VVNEPDRAWLLAGNVQVVEPLVVTLVVDQPAADRFDAVRSALFPTGRTAVGAHVTLFHAVPGQLRDTVLGDVRTVCERPAFPVRVRSVDSLGRGAAFGLSSPELDDVHRTLQRSWWDSLTPQDRQGFRPHVTVQNKVSPDDARRTVQRLRATFEPYDVTAEGLAVWRYVGGPWEPVQTISFAG
jgi:2'-5' RNA ligase